MKICETDYSSDVTKANLCFSVKLLDVCDAVRIASPQARQKDSKKALQMTELLLMYHTVGTVLSSVSGPDSLSPDPDPSFSVKYPSGSRVFMIKNLQMKKIYIKNCHPIHATGEAFSPKKRIPIQHFKT